MCACMLSRIRLFVTPWTVADQGLLPMGFSRQEYWSGLPFPPPRESFRPRDCLHWQADSSVLSHLGSHTVPMMKFKGKLIKASSYPQGTSSSVKGTGMQSKRWLWKHLGKKLEAGLASRAHRSRNGPWCFSKRQWVWFYTWKQRCKADGDPL